MERLELSQELGRDILGMAKAQGASQGDVVMVESDSFFVTVRLGEVEKISQAQEKRLGLRLFFGSSSASASTSDISKKSVARLVEDTTRMAQATAQDPHSGLPAAEDLAREIPELDLLDADARSISVEEKIQMALAAEKPPWSMIPGLPTAKVESSPISSGGSSTSAVTAFPVSTRVRLSVTRWPQLPHRTVPCNGTIGIHRIGNSRGWSLLKSRRESGAARVEATWCEKGQNL